MQKERLNLLSFFILISAVTLVLGNYFSDSYKVETDGVKIDTSSPTTRIVVPGELEVKSSLGDPVPLTAPLQGARGASQQEAAGSLQTPGTADQIQPNAKLPEFPTEL